MTFGIQTFNASGVLQFDSTTALGGVIVTTQNVAANTTAYTLNYPQFAGTAGFLLFNDGNSPFYTSLSFSSGYPVVTVNKCPAFMSFSLYLY